MKIAGILLSFALVASVCAAEGPEVLLEVGGTPTVARASEGDLIGLKDGRWLLAYSEFPTKQSGRYPAYHDHASAVIVAQTSADRGRTWTEPVTIVSPEAGDLNVMSVSLLRLRDGRLALFYIRKRSEADGRPVMRVSDDEGRTWGPAHDCIDDSHRDYYVVNNARVLRLSTGRIIIPLCRHSVDATDPQGCESEGRLCVVASDDDGRTWRMICEPFKVLDRLRSRVTVQEPGIVELKDGRLLMYLRTNRRAHWGTYSSDGGVTWSPPSPLPLVAPNLSNATIVRLSDGNLVAVWNDYSGMPSNPAHQTFAEPRSPFSIAWSKDDGRTWSPSRTIDADAPDAKPEDKLYCCYFSVREIGGALHIFHCHHGDLRVSHLTRIPIDWIYGGAAAAPDFAGAESVWPKGLADEMNTLVGFRASFEATAADRPVLEMAAWYSYRISLNGRFIGFGPSRGPKGWFRPDRWDLSGALREGANDLLIEVAGYNVPNFYLPQQPPFLKAMVKGGGRILAETCAEGGSFVAVRRPRVQKVVRYSYQRTFSEHYRLPGPSADPLPIVKAPEPRLLERRAPYPDFETSVMKPVSFATVREDPSASVVTNRALSKPTDRGWFKGFTLDEVELNASFLAQRLFYSGRHSASAEERTAAVFPLSAGQSAVFDRGLDDSGFPGASVEVVKPGRLVFSFDEVLTGDEVRGVRRTGDCNVLVWDFEKPGHYEVDAFEPYTLRYLDVSVLSGEMTVSAPRFRSYKNPTAKRATLKASDPALERIFAAAVETFRQNAADVFTDCPGRERAGWNCDAYFTAPVSALLTGGTALEQAFVECQVLPESFDCLPEGMLPMCYPSDHRNGSFIPNWAMWFVLQSEEYLRRSGDREMEEMLKPKLEKLVAYLKDFRNADGLLENLPSWVFIEWSKSNDFVDGVNYPSNMTWADTLDAVARICARPDLAEEAAHVRETIRRQSWTGAWFCDNARRQQDGTLKLSGECTETCQYYAFFHGVATPESHPKLWRTLLDDFGPKRFDPSDRTKLLSHPEIWPSNAFIGNYLRLKLLERYGVGQRILDETKDYFLYMADRTGTLWENDTTCASCNHGFASYAAVLLVKSVLGVDVDGRSKHVVLRETDAFLPFGEITLPAEGGTIRVARRRDASGRIAFDCDVPDGWKVLQPSSAGRYGAEVLWERTVARDNYVGWPTVCQRANGELLAVYSGDRRGHVTPYGKVRLVRSSDGGTTWSDPVTVQDGVLDDRDAGLIELRNGDLALFWFTSTAFGSYRGGRPYGKTLATMDPETVRTALGNWCALSHDGGITWDNPVRLNSSAPHGAIQLRDGRLLQVGRRGTESRHDIVVEESSDGGRTWTVTFTFPPTPGIDFNQLHEPHVAETAGGRLVCQMRSHQGVWHLCQAESSDGGRTWTAVHDLPMDVFPEKCIPPHLLPLKDGRLLSVVGCRYGGAFGERAFLSADEGRTWGPAGGIELSRGFDDDLGYPSSVQLDDGTVLTVFYQSERCADQPVLKAVKWRLPNK